MKSLAAGAACIALCFSTAGAGLAAPASPSHFKRLWQISVCELSNGSHCRHHHHRHHHHRR